jgi:uncharacterized protein YggE
VRRSRMFASIIIVLIAGTRLLAAQNVTAPIPQIVTAGTGAARIAPDRATIFVGLETRATTAAAAGAENARRQRAIIDTLRALGLTNEQLSTVNYNVSPEMQYSPNGQTPPKVTGYTVTNTVRADVRRLDDVGKVIDASLAKGANEISSLNFFSSKADSVRRSAMESAVLNARADAEVLARAAGGTVGPLIEISSSEIQPQPIQHWLASPSQRAHRLKPGSKIFRPPSRYVGRSFQIANTGSDHVPRGTIVEMCHVERCFGLPRTLDWRRSDPVTAHVQHRKTTPGANRHLD